LLVWRIREETVYKNGHENANQAFLRKEEKFALFEYIRLVHSVVDLTAKDNAKRSVL